MSLETHFLICDFFLFSKCFDNQFIIIFQFLDIAVSSLSITLSIFKASNNQGKISLLLGDGFFSMLVRFSVANITGMLKAFELSIIFITASYNLSSPISAERSLCQS